MILTREEIYKTLHAGESLTVEFKEEPIQPISDSELIEEIISLANAKGGLLFLGVDKAGKIKGTKPRHGATTEIQQLVAMIFNRTVPNLTVDIEIPELDEGTITIIKVPKSERPVGTTQGKYRRRVILGNGEPGCIPWHFHEMTSQVAQRGDIDYSSLPVTGSSNEDLDPIEFGRLRSMIRQRATADKYLLDLPNGEIAKVLGLMDELHATIAGLLILGKEEAIAKYVSAHEIAFQMFWGMDLRINDYMKAPLLKSLEKIMNYFVANNREKEVMLPIGVRLGIPDYSPSGFREAVINAIVHRSYGRLGAIVIQWYGDRLEITNPGGLIEGVTIDNILVTPPKPRNRTLADVFKRIGLVERSGRGVDTIYQGQLRYGRPIPDYSKTTENDVCLVLPGGPANLEFTRLIIENERSGHSLDLNEIIILNELQREKTIDVERARRLTQQSDTIIRAMFGKLTERGYVEKRGEKKWRSYHLSSYLYQKIGEHDQYIRQRGFDRLQQEQMVLQSVKENGKIRKREVVLLCNLTENQAITLLRRLVKSKRLRLKGKRKGAYYVLHEDIYETGIKK